MYRSNGIIKQKIMAKTYKALMVQKETHTKVAVEAKKAGLTIDQYINKLINN